MRQPENTPRSPLTYYQMLGVHPGATRQAIRTAYIARIKLAHPDLLAAGTDDASARDINRAFTVLRDPATRSQYDKELADAASRQRNQLVDMPPSRARRTYARRFGALLLLFSIAAATGLFIARPPTWNASFDGFADPAQPALEPATPDPASGPAGIDPWNVSDAVADFRFVQRDFGMDGVEQLSRQCHADLVDYPSLRLLDRCFAFDTVAGVWAEKSGEGASPYFGPELRNKRYWAAAARLSRNPRFNVARKVETERLTLSAIALYFTPEVDPNTGRRPSKTPESRKSRPPAARPG